MLGSAVLHDWPDAICITILKHLRDAAKPSTRLVIDESLITPAVRHKDEPCLLANGGSANKLIGTLDLAMMTVANAQERSKADFETLLARSGWKLERVVQLKNGLRSLLEAVPA